MSPLKGRGAPANDLPTRFALPAREADGDWLDHVAADDEETLPPLRTTVTQEVARTIITRNDSPDVGFQQSINAYRGCEHVLQSCNLVFSVCYETNGDFPMTQRSEIMKLP
jgi:hypothetical protein